MGGEYLGHRARLLLLIGLDLFKEIYERGRVVAGFIEILQAEHVRLRLKAAAELEESQRNQNAGRLADAVSRPSTHEDQRDGGKVHQLSAGGLPAAVACANVRHI